MMWKSGSRSETDGVLSMEVQSKQKTPVQKVEPSEAVRR